ncbi:MAG: TonB-dependent receptor [Ignavibacteriaceae bacterium]
MEYSIFFTSCIFVLSFGFTKSIYGQGEPAKKDTSAQSLSEMNLEDLLNVQVTTASKKAEKTSDAPAVMETISSTEIKAYGANSLMDILQRATSIQPMSNSIFPDNISIMRGDLNFPEDTHVLLLIDGRPVREGTNGGTDNSFYTGFPIESIDHIEIIRGPGSVLYGSNAFCGVINIVTKKDEVSSLNVSATEGSFGTTRSAINGSVTSGDFNAKVSLKIDDITGWDFNMVTKTPAPAKLIANYDMDQHNIGALGDVNYKDLSLTVFFANTDQNMLGIIPLATWAGQDKFQKVFVNLGYDHKFNDNWGATINLTDNSDILNMDDNAVATVDNHLQSLDYLGELTINGKLSDNANLVFGGTYLGMNENAFIPGQPVAPYHLHSLSAYIQGDYRPVDALKLILGGQMNKPEGQSTSFVPRLGAIYDFTNDFGLKVLYGQAFRSPYPTELYLQNPTIVGNPDLAPEKIGTFDAQLFYSGSSGEISIDYYNSYYFDNITRIPTANPAVLTYTNEGTLTDQGVELQGKYSISTEFFISGSASYQKNTDNEMVTPNFMGKIGVIYKPGYGVSVGLFNTYFGAPQANTGAVVNPPANAVSLFSANISYKLPTSFPLEFTLYGQNLFNSSYYFTEYVRDWVNTFPVGPGRSVYGKVSIGI